jgi:uncharacterized membrane protein (UPF0127 family)
MGYRIGAAVLIVYIVLSGCFCTVHGGEGQVAFYNAGGQKTCVFKVEVAITPEEHERGLMFREKLPDNGGMFFLYNDDDIRYFWMKNTFISLDMIFIDSKRKVVGVHHNARPMDETTISSRYPARYVLEVKAGRAKQCNIKTGTQARFINIPVRRYR